MTGGRETGQRGGGGMIGVHFSSLGVVVGVVVVVEQEGKGRGEDWIE